jgi:hypothetical protein
LAFRTGYPFAQKFACHLTIGALIAESQKKPKNEPI